MPGKEYQKPSIELFMFSLHQEFPEGVSHNSFTKRNIETRDVLTAKGEQLTRYKISDNSIRQVSDWPAEWLHAKWLTDHTKSITGLFEQTNVSPLRMALTRQEEFGGVIYDPFSDKVYKVNKSGLELFSEIRSFAKGGKALSAFKSKSFKKEDIAEFLAFLKGAGLWSDK
jgi:hypothetical protein